MNKIAKNTFIALINQLVNTIFPVIIFGYLARLLSPSLLGELSLSQSIASLLGMLVFIGLPIYGVREIAKCGKDKEQAKNIISELFVLNVVIMITFYLIFVTIVELYLRTRMDVKLLYIVSIAVVISPFLMNYVIEGFEEFKFIAVRNVTVKLATLLVVIFVVKTKEDIYHYAWIYSLITLLTALYNINFIIKNIGFDIRHVRKEAIYLHLSKTKPIFITGIMSSVYIFTDQIMIGIISDTKNVANYAIADKVIKIIVTTVAVVNIVMLPRVSSIRDETQKIKIRAERDLICNAILFLCIPGVVGLLFISEAIVTLISGSQYNLAITILKIIAINILIIPLTTFIYYQVCIPNSQEHKILVATCFGALINIIGNLVFIPMLGAVGAAYVTVFTEIIVLFVAIFMTREFLNPKVITNELWKRLMSSFLMVVFLYFYKKINLGEPYYSLILIFGACVIYIGSSYLLKDNILKSFFDKNRNESV